MEKGGSLVGFSGLLALPHVLRSDCLYRDTHQNSLDPWIGMNGIDTTAKPVQKNLTPYLF